MKIKSKKNIYACKYELNIKLFTNIKFKKITRDYKGDREGIPHINPIP